ncbi:MAG: glycosylase, partial [Flavisolibacter sp.]|nr:glycosylase [Flavisolibacter sp.]
MTIKRPLALLLILFFSFTAFTQSDKKKVPDSKMQEIYQEIKTPYKYGLVMVPADNSQKIDCPSVFRKGKMWYMTYLVFAGRGYETWLAKSNDLLHWQTMGRIMSF